MVRFPTISPQCERPRQPLYARARKRIFGELALAVPLKPLYAGARNVSRRAVRREHRRVVGPRRPKPPNLEDARLLVTCDRYVTGLQCVQDTYAAWHLAT